MLTAPKSETAWTITMKCGTQVYMCFLHCNGLLVYAVAVFPRSCSYQLPSTRKTHKPGLGNVHKKMVAGPYSDITFYFLHSLSTNFSQISYSRSDEELRLN